MHVTWPFQPGVTCMLHCIASSQTAGENVNKSEFPMVASLTTNTSINSNIGARLPCARIVNKTPKIQRKSIMFTPTC